MVAAHALDRLLEPIFTPEVASRFLDFKPHPEFQLRRDALRSRANEGLLTTAEREEYEQFVEALDVLAMLKTQARAALDRQRQ